MINAFRARFLSSLVAKITLTMAALSFVLLAVVTTVDVYTAIEGQRQIVASEQHAVAENVAKDVQRFIEEKLEDLFHTVTHVDFVASFDKLPDNTLGSILAQTLNHQPAFRSVAYITPSGPRVLKTVSGQEKVELNAPLEQRRVLETTGRGKTYIGVPFVDEQTKEPFIIIAIPVDGASSTVAGAFAAELRLTYMWDLLDSMSLRNDGIAYVVDREGTLVAFGDTKRVYSRENVASLSPVNRFRAGKDHSASASELSTGIRGDSVIATFVPLMAPDWAVVVESPIRSAYAPIIELLKITAFLIVASLIATVSAAYYLARRVTRPLAEVRDAAVKIGAGKLDTRINTNLPNEIADLAEVLNHMAESLQNSYHTLAERVREKTAALSVQVDETNKAKLAVLNLLEDVEEEKQRVEEMIVARTHELNEEKARLLASINSLPFGFIIADEAGNILLKNPVLGKILDTTTNINTLTEVSTLIKNVDIISTCKQCQINQGIADLKEVPYGKKFLHVSCAQVSEGEHIIGNIILIEDITEARILDRSRDEFFSIASHELRTPLTAIRGNADMILEMYADKIPDKDMREMLEDINVSSVRLIGIVNDFLEVSRLEQRKIEAKKESFNLEEILEKVLRDMRPTIEKAGLSLNYIAPNPPLPQVYADRGYVEQVLVNLIGNSAKFTKMGSISIETELQGGQVRVLVKDTGIGISEQNQALLFRKFQQAGEQILARDVTQGTGLGLYICNLLVSGMGGTIGLEKSEMGKGSSFFFTVPLAQGTIQDTV